jgi:hypothetical protein
MAALGGTEDPWKLRSPPETVSTERARSTLPSTRSEWRGESVGNTHPMSDDKPVLMPSDVSTRAGFFDRFAGQSSEIVGQAPFFAFSVLLVVIWAPTILLLRSVDTWQLITNTVTTIITFLMVVLLQNSQTRSDQAIQHKLTAIADGPADLMAYMEDRGNGRDLPPDLGELRAAVGLEEHESRTPQRRTDQMRSPARRASRRKVSEFLILGQLACHHRDDVGPTVGVHDREAGRDLVE